MRLAVNLTSEKVTVPASGLDQKSEIDPAPVRDTGPLHVPEKVNGLAMGCPVDPVWIPRIPVATLVTPSEIYISKFISSLTLARQPHRHLVHRCPHW